MRLGKHATARAIAWSRRSLIGTIAVTMLVAGCNTPIAAPPGFVDSITPSPASTAPSSDLTSVSGPQTDAADPVMVALVAAGIDITSDDAPRHGPGTLTLTASQASVWAADAVGNGGLTGRQLRERFPTGDDAVPLDAMVAAWLVSSSAPAADAARTIVDVSTIGDPQDVRFPWAVLAMFIQDVTSSDPAELSHTPSGFRAPTDTSFDACGMLSGLYEATIGKITSWFDTAGADSTIIAIAGQALSLFGAFLGKAISTLLAPLIKPIKAAIGALSVATAIVGAVVPWSAQIVATPPANAFGIVPAAGQTGGFVVTVSTALPDWPAGVRSCAKLAGVELPSISPAGSNVTWTFSGNSVATETHNDPVLTPGDYPNASLDYVTGVETAQDAKGSAVVDPVMVVAEIERDKTALVAVVNTLIGNALDMLPDIITALLIGPAEDALSGVLELSGATAMSDPVWVTHHVAPPEDPPANPPPANPPANPPPSADESCIGVELVSTLTRWKHDGMTEIMPGAATMYLKPNHTGYIDFTGSTNFYADNARGTISGKINFHWSGGPKIIHTDSPHGNLVAKVLAGGVVNEIDLPIDAMTTTNETLICSKGDITFKRTGWTFY